MGGKAGRGRGDWPAGRRREDGLTRSSASLSSSSSASTSAPTLSFAPASIPPPSPSVLLPPPLPSFVPPPTFPGWASRGSGATRSTPSSPSIPPAPSHAHVPHRRRGSGSCVGAAGAAVFDSGTGAPSHLGHHLQSSSLSASSSFPLDATRSAGVGNANLPFAIATAEPTITPAKSTSTILATPPSSLPATNFPSSPSEFATISALGPFWPSTAPQPAVAHDSVISGAAVSTALASLVDLASLPQATNPPVSTVTVAQPANSSLFTIRSPPLSPQLQPQTPLFRPPHAAAAAGPKKLEPRPRPKTATSMPAARPLGPDGGGTSSSSASSTPNPKRPADVISDDGSTSLSRAGPGGKTKLPRLERGGDDFSSVVKNRLQSYTRTGQACDRCKVRKIRCDALPEGCSHCINLNLDCYVTDRVTGRTERRGYLQQLEREKNGMLTHIRDLEHMLWDKGVEVKPYSARPSDADASDDLEDGWTQVRSLCVKHHSESADNTHPLVPNFPRIHLESRPEFVSLGGGLDVKPYGSVNGTRLQIMGATIDTASFELPDLDEPQPNTEDTPIYNKSVQAFLRSTMGRQPAMQVDLPSRKDAFTYAEWFFLIMAAYIPVLHKPSFMARLSRIYDEPSFEPTVSELVQVHMVLAIIYYQYGVRNREDAEQRDHLNNLSNRHYHFSLSKFYDLLSSRDLSALQALTLISSHTRSFPKPGCGTIVANLAFQRAIELNLHRSPEMPASGTNMNIELRKRTWWVLLGSCVGMTGRRGRPMPITVEEFDVGLPEPYNDDALLEDGIDQSKINAPCEWEVGRTTFKLLPIMMEMYSNLYGARRDKHNYKRIVYALETELSKMEDGLPDSVRVGTADQQHNVGALYIKMYAQEIRLWLRHNSVNPTTDKRLIVENTKICEETARELLHTVQKIIELKSLDTTWTQMSIYAMSLFSMLVAGWERRTETTPEQLVVLRKEMDEWLAVLKELSLMMGAGPGIADAISGVVARTILWIENDMPKGEMVQQASASGTSSANASRSPPSVAQIKSEPHADQVPNRLPAAQPTAPSLPRGSQPSGLRGFLDPHTNPSSQPPPQQHQHNNTYYNNHGLNGHETYPPLAYNDQHQSNNAGAQAYGTDSGLYYTSQNQHAATAVPGSGHDVQANPLIAFASQATHQVDPAAEQLMWQRSGANAWQEWTAAIADSQDRYGAGALLTLGGATTAAPVSRNSMPSMENGGQSATHDLTAQWPLVMFDNHGPQHYPSEQQHQHDHQL